MGFDLSNESGDSFRFGGTGWSFVLNLVEQYGWEAAGTSAPEGWDEGDEWPGNYDMNDGQNVNSGDAHALADALDAAANDPQLEHVASRIEDAFREMIESQVGPDLAQTYEVGLGDTDEARQFLREFSEFCRKGPFIIE